jgi:hypothetical protein
MLTAVSSNRTRQEEPRLINQNAKAINSIRDTEAKQERSELRNCANKSYLLGPDVLEDHTASFHREEE